MIWCKHVLWFIFGWLVIKKPSRFHQPQCFDHFGAQFNIIIAIAFDLVGAGKYIDTSIFIFMIDIGKCPSFDDGENVSLN